MSDAVELTPSNFYGWNDGFYEDEYTGKTVKFITNTKIYGLSNSLRVSKLPMRIDAEKVDDNNDVAMKLAKLPSATAQDNWLSGVTVQFDLKFTIKAWTEFERYHFAQIVSSQSTMHKITRFDLDTAYNYFVDPEIINMMKQKVRDYNNYIKDNPDWEDDELKRDVVNYMYMSILYSNPCGMYLTAGITTNYRQLKSIYRQRLHHRLQEWREFCKYIKTLPYLDEMLGV